MNFPYLWSVNYAIYKIKKTEKKLYKSIIVV